MQKDLVINVAHSARQDTQSHTREDVGIVSLPRVEGLPIQRAWWEGASAGKDAPTLEASTKGCAPSATGSGEQETVHSKPGFPAPSSKLWQNWLRH